MFIRASPRWRHVANLVNDSAWFQGSRGSQGVHTGKSARRMVPCFCTVLIRPGCATGRVDHIGRVICDPVHTRHSFAGCTRHSIAVVCVRHLRYYTPSGRRGWAIRQRLNVQRGINGGGNGRGVKLILPVRHVATYYVATALASTVRAVWPDHCRRISAS